MAITLFRYLESGGYHPEIAAISTPALHAARDLGDHCAQAQVLSNLAAVDVRQGRYEQAADNLQALALFRETVTTLAKPARWATSVSSGFSMAATSKPLTTSNCRYNSGGKGMTTGEKQTR